LGGKVVNSLSFKSLGINEAGVLIGVHFLLLFCTVKSREIC
jgi:hypothetical protein